MLLNIKVFYVIIANTCSLYLFEESYKKKISRDVQIKRFSSAIISLGYLPVANGKRAGLVNYESVRQTHTHTLTETQNC